MRNLLNMILLVLVISIIMRIVYEYTRFYILESKYMIPTQKITILTSVLEDLREFMILEYVCVITIKFN